MRLRVAPQAAGGADLVKVLPPRDRLYARWYMRYEPGFNFDAPNHGGGLFAGDRNFLGQSGNRPSGSDFFLASLEHTRGSDLFPHTIRSYVYYRGMYQDCANPSGSCWGDSLPCEFDTGQAYCTRAADRPPAGFNPAPLVAGNWYCVELLLEGGTPTVSATGANGGLNFWVNGNEQAPGQLRHWMRTTATLKPNILWLSLYHHDGTHSEAGVFYDNVVVSTARIGCQ